MNLFSKEDYEEILIDNLNWKPISCFHQTELCKPFDEKEIKSTIMSISNEKAPGPDALISKKDKCSMPSDYRPISLTTSLYKIMAKALENRLKTTLPDTVAENQMAFIKGRQITDAILIANEAIDTWKKRKTKGFVLKLDIEKDFDKISWSFIDFMLAKKNFPIKWRKWINAYISNVQYSILLYGTPKGRIKA
ncbi:LINE-1 retrotransposable element ORF2 protein [Cucumis melo var. makuwa]|uniref:LINE-1 retrotransposable element ORF2 protein n=1 Tax=Cucumis melo var. makuwa TaxID=1194695 RepID=A0A5A7U3W9_CUCMM|nr:LINE-1 retrotransposable element ORF2 protein [Cucumis melo var. makuwa]TYK07710.1 LINE-1 retrotransposable element ORF2 protein [Cucumis melo var. makuwa]